jgi:DNA-binding LacI/PurR family transcriptional regulator
MGELAGRLLKQGIQVGRPLEAQEIVLPVELITRASVGKPRRQRKLGSTTTSDDVE